MQNILPDSDKEVRDAIFSIRAKNQTGTGFLIVDNRHILTAHHVVKAITPMQESVTISQANGMNVSTALVQKVWPHWDIALLRLNDPLTMSGIKPFALSQQKNIATTAFSSYGFPSAYGADWFYGTVGNEGVDQKYTVTFSINFDPLHYGNALDGLSGGPVFASNDRSSVIGIICEHGPANYQMGKIAPIASIYQEIAVEISSEAPSPWCYVVLSEAEDPLKAPYTLQQAVEDAFQGEQHNLKFARSTDLVATEDAYQEAVKDLCQAPIAIFDITDYEPAVMLLLGIRSVVRRGVTIASGGNFKIGDPIDFPFNIKDLNIISHSKSQHDVKGNDPPFLIIRNMIRQGMEQLHKIPQYLDTPTFDAIRNLPAEYRQPDSNNVLLLCSYSKNYQENNWNMLENRLRPYLPPDQPNYRIMRVLDIVSPRLVSSATYEAIRLTSLCIIDWTEWSPNVFFELGVRLAVTKPGRFTVCIIEGKCKHLIDEIRDDLSNCEEQLTQAEPTKLGNLISQFTHLDPAKKRDLTNLKKWYVKSVLQCQHLISLFHPLVYNIRTISFPDANLTQKLRFDLNIYRAMMYHYNNPSGTANQTPPDQDGLAPDITYKVIEKYIDAEIEITSLPVYQELLRTADLFNIEDKRGETAILYPGNETLKEKVLSGYYKRLLAAWYVIKHVYRYSDEQILQENGLSELASKLLLSPLSEEYPELITELRRIVNQKG